jgi:hypothetical protein
MLVNYVDSKQSNWSKYLKILTYNYNNTRHSTSQYTPFELLYGRQGKLISELGLENIVPPSRLYVKDLYKNMLQIRKQAYLNIVKAQERMRKQYNKHRRKAKVFKKDDLVLLYYKKKCPGKLSKKLTFHVRGVYKIVRKIPDRDNYVIRLVNKRKGVADRELTVNVDQIREFLIPNSVKREDAM